MAPLSHSREQQGSVWWPARPWPTSPNRHPPWFPLPTTLAILQLLALLGPLQPQDLSLLPRSGSGVFAIRSLPNLHLLIFPALSIW